MMIHDRWTKCLEFDNNPGLIIESLMCHWIFSSSNFATFEMTSCQSITKPETLDVLDWSLCSSASMGKRSLTVVLQVEEKLLF